jgi:hypothetical protein
VTEPSHACHAALTDTGDSEPEGANDMKIALMVVRITGLFQLITGLAFWTGNLLFLIPFHMLSGLILVLALWAAAFFGARAGAPMWLVALSVVWGLLTPALGMTQTGLMPGDMHWVIQVAHLLVGVVAIYLAQRLAMTSGPRSVMVTAQA